ncbi:diguanylate cyclase [Pseudocolwellia sp. AS88]|uniref:diguanylate cyclase n=1 Tax=Pseudocolwellia sp. AS88 TaxID=3063958 RepID=UPI0026F0268A|nr:diguanylate cyclase [Pseudocolwellia sp. AS88]MDO7084953.1 diguanylate cyclase [Pseudocolwellia sp. AS88]
MKTESNYKILAIDDAKDSLMLLDFDLSEEGYGVITAESASDAFQLLENNNINLILLNMYMPGISGLEMLKKLKSIPEYKHIPIIMLSSSDDEDQIVSALDLGADDYVTKPYISKVLLARIKTSLRLFEKTKALESLANTDFLTGLPNKGSFESQAINIVEQANREGKNIIIGMLDIDFFKSINDTYGHEAGDKVLVEFSQILDDCFRGYDALGRVGGEEFSVCMSNISVDDAFSAFERFRNIIEKHTIFINCDDNQDIPLKITVSIGLAENKGAHLVFEDILREADRHLYIAKESGRNCIEIDKTSDITIKATLKNLEISINKANDAIKINNSEDELLNVQSTENQQSPFPGIDYDIGVGNVLGDKDLYKEILLMFYEDHAKDADNIQKALTEFDKDNCKRLVHTLKGVSCSIGAMDLFERVKLLDIAINESNEGQYQMLFDAFKPEFLKVVNGIETVLADDI